MKRIDFLIAGIYLFFGVYLLNLFFQFIPFPAEVIGADSNLINSWVFFISGIILVIAGFNHLRLGNKTKKLKQKKAKG